MSVTTKKQAAKGGWRDTIKVVIEALLLALVVRTFLFQPFSIPSGSMMSTLLVGDYLFVSKYSYGYSRYSFPFGLAPFEGRIWSAPPERGDIVVFKLPSDPSKDYIKRLIGLPGDKIQMKEGQLFINGQPVPREKVGQYVEESPFGSKLVADVYRETLPNGVSYDTLNLMDGSSTDDTREFEVPPGHYFMIGDNRDNSRDSRVAGSGVDMVPFENLVGKAQVIFFSMSGDDRPWMVWTWPSSLRWDRMFTSLD